MYVEGAITGRSARVKAVTAIHVSKIESVLSSIVEHTSPNNPLKFSLEHVSPIEGRSQLRKQEKTVKQCNKLLPKRKKSPRPIKAEGW